MTPLEMIQGGFLNEAREALSGLSALELRRLASAARVLEGMCQLDEAHRDLTSPSPFAEERRSW